MDLSNDLISKFVKITNDDKNKNSESTVYGTVVEYNGGMYVRIDGSDLLTPVETTADFKPNERVTVMIKNHSATVTGNITSPSTNEGAVIEKVTEAVEDVEGKVITEVEILIADRVSTGQLDAEVARIDELIAGKASVEDLTATNAEITNLKADKASVKDLTATNAEITNLKAKDAEIENLVAGKATVEDLTVTNAEITNLKAKDAEIENLVADKARIEDLTATNARIDSLQANKADITYLDANFATIDELEAAHADIEILDAELADINTLVNGNLTSDNILSLNITSQNTTMENAFVKDAMIDTVTANKIMSGTIDTNNVTIQSTDGSMLLQGTLLQMKDDNGKVRIQIGKDTGGNFTFILYDESGTGVLIDEEGIKSSDAIADGLIVDAKVADNANIAGSKLDIASVITEVNNDNSTTIKSNKIYLDEQGQSLEVAFNSLKTHVDTIQDVTIDGDLTVVKEQVQSNTTQIAANKEGISTLVSENTIRKEEIQNLDGEIESVNNTLSSKYSSLEQDVSGFKTTVADTYATKQSVTDINNNLSSNYSTTSQMNSAIQQKANEITSSVSETYTTKSEFNNLEIGGRNLVQKKNIKYGYLTEGTGNPVSTPSLNGNQDYYSEFYIPVKAGEKYTITTYNSTSSITGYIAAHIYDSNKTWLKAYTSEQTNLNSTTPISRTFTIEVDGYMRYSCRGLNSINTKLEKGNRATDWTPAPEDVEAGIDAVADNLANNYSTTSAMNSAIQQKANEITSSVSQTYATKQSVTDVSNNLATNYSTTSAMNSAINQKANEITSTVSETYATKQSVTDVSNNLATNYSTTTQMNSAINQKANEITSTVSETYTTKSEFNNLEIGGVNLIRNSTASNNFKDWNISTDYIDMFEVYYSNGSPRGFTADLIDNNGRFISTPYLELAKGETYTLTFWKKNTDTSRHWIGIYYTNTSGAIKYITIFNYGDAVNSDFTKYSKQFTMPSDYSSNAELRFYCYSANPMTIIDIKLEKGNKATSWSKHPDDDVTYSVNDSTNLQRYSAPYLLGDNPLNSVYTWARGVGSVVDDTVFGGTCFKLTISPGQTNSYFESKFPKLGGINELFRFEEGVEYTVSLDYSLGEYCSGFQVVFYNEDDSKSQYLDPVYKSDISQTYKHRYNKTFVAKWSDYAYFLIYNIGVSNSTDTQVVSNLLFSNIKIEKGNKATAWTPAPKDIQGQIDATNNNLQNNYSTTTQMNSAINQKANEITSSVSATYATKQSVTDVSNNLSSNYSTTSAMNSAIQQKANEITSSVSQTYATKSEFNNLEIGGRNLVQKKNIKYGYLTEGTGNPVSTPSLNGNQDYYSEFYIPVKAGEKYTITTYNSTSSITGYIAAHIYDSNKTWLKAYTSEQTNLNSTTPISRTFTIEVDGYMRYSCRGLNSINTKLEKGNRATDWTPAPEDIQGQIDATNNNLQNNYSTTTQMNSAIEQKANEITSSVSETYATKQSVTDVSNNLATNYSTTSAMNSAINQKANEITSSVSETYATKQSVTDVSNNLATNYSTTSAMNSAINQKANEITSSVSQTYTTKSEFNNLQIGGKNLLLDSKREITNNGYCIDEFRPTELFEVGEKYTVSICVTPANGVNHIQPYISGGYASLSAPLYVNGTTKQVLSRTFTFNGYVSDKVPVDISDYNARVQFYRFPNDGTVTSNTTLHWVKVEKGAKATDWSPAPEDVQGQIDATNNNLATNYSTTSAMNSAIQQKANEITSSVSQTYATKQSVTDINNNLTNNYSTTSQMNTAIQQKANEITSSVSQTYITNYEAKKLADTTTTGLNKYLFERYQRDGFDYASRPTLNDLVGARLIESRLVDTPPVHTSDLGSNYIGVLTFYLYYDYACTKTVSVTTDDSGTVYLNNVGIYELTSCQPANVTFNMIKGLNRIDIVYAEGGGGDGVSWGGVDGFSAFGAYANVVTNEIANRTNELTLAMTQGNMLYTDPTFRSGNNGVITYNNLGNNTVTKERIASIEGCPNTSGYCLKITTNGEATPGLGGFAFANMARRNAVFITKITAKIPIGYKIGWASNATGNNTEQKWLSTINGTGNWHDYYCKVKCGDSGDFSSTNYFYLIGPQASAENPVTWYVSYATVFDVTDSDERITNLTNNLAVNYSTTSQMNSAIQQKANEITNTVSSTYLSIAEATNSYATKSNLSQTADSLTATFSGSGGYNLIRNGHANKGTSYWQSNGGGLSYATGAGGSVNGNFFTTTMPNGVVYYDWIELKPNTHYVYQAKVYIDGSTLSTSWSSSPLHYHISDASQVHGTTDISILDYQQSISAASTWTQCYMHFVTPNISTVYFKPFMYTGGDSKTFYFSEVMLSESRIALPWSPHPSEVYDGITTIDKDGIKVSHSNANGYTHMAPDGFFINNNGEDILTATASGLYVKGNITSGSTIQGARITGSTFNSSNDVFQVLEDGTIETSFLAVNGAVSTDKLNVNNIENASYPKVLSEATTVYISPNGGVNAEEFYDGAYFTSLSNMLAVAPRNLNGYTLTIRMAGDLYENAALSWFHSGQVNFEMQGYTLYGYFYGYGASMCYRLYGNTNANNNGTWGHIKPNVGRAMGSYYYAVQFQYCQFAVNYVAVYPSASSGSSSGGIGVHRGATGIIFNAKACGDMRYLVRAEYAGRVHVNSTQGACNNATFCASTGGIITLNSSNDQAGRSTTGNPYWVGSGGLILCDQLLGMDKITFNNTSQSGSSSSSGSTTRKVTETVKASSADTYRSTVYNSWKGDGTVRQGDYGYGDCQGCWFFGNNLYTTMNAGTVTKVVIRIQRQSGGVNAPQTLTVKSHNHTSRPSGAPTYTNTIGTCSCAVGSYIDLVITDSTTINKLKNCKGLGLSIGSASSPYAVCSGACSVIITYTTNS